MARDVNEVLEHAIRGGLETKPAERRIFLTTIAERLHLALTINQVRSNVVYPEVERVLKAKPNIQMFINGQLAYSDYNEYVKLAMINNIPYTVVSATTDTPFGLVIANQNIPVETSHPYIEDDVHKQDIERY
ncbi:MULTISPECIES: YueI family protein [Shouchella]|uniref:YueI family protein n=2 Tax=Shouchella TaxID=2893057 RepID=A0ABY7W3D3_9BACI|nr:MULTISPECIES: YueI family protein [Shouchella]MED4127935.1 YueI family protein [Shouchella miscanthi]WDF03081.1 YueI family protein [Shouchella hunanensis]GAF24030.1 hypothetical protein JCM19047_3891 [Bacillus sp. JCM 19047]